MGSIQTDFIPLSLAAQRLGVSRTIAYDLVLTGRLVGEIKRGRWQVSRASVEELAAIMNDKTHRAAQ